ncbi:MAG: hypothetical protein JSS53_07490 [Proteobacteria bacterium]|nr:hypothetical protein [Pseudomonadota bacterium]
MIDYKLIFAGIALLVTIIQYGTYIIDIFHGKTRPHAFSWFVWGLPCGIVFAAQFLDGGGAGTWTTAMTAVLCTVIFVLSLFYGEKKITKLDWASLFVALFSIILWVLVKDPLGSVILITIIDVLGFAPTVRKSIQKPYEETLNTYVTGGLKWMLALFALSNFSLTVWIYPVAMLIANWGFAGMLLVRRISLAKFVPNR